MSPNPTPCNTGNPNTHTPTTHSHQSTGQLFTPLSNTYLHHNSGALSNTLPGTSAVGLLSSADANKITIAAPSATTKRTRNTFYDALIPYPQLNGTNPCDSFANTSKHINQTQSLHTNSSNPFGHGTITLRLPSPTFSLQFEPNNS